MNTMCDFKAQLSYWSRMLDEACNEEHFLCEDIEEKNVSPQIEYWAHMLDECFDKEQFLCEDVEGKNINRAEKWIKQNRPELIGREINGRVMTRARDVVT